MAFSVNTNAAAFVALQTLNKTNSGLDKTQNAINTGMKVASAKDNAAVFAIAQNLRSNVSGLNAVKQSIDNALGATDVAMAAGQAVSDLLVEMKEKAVAAADKGQDTASRTALNDDFTQLRDQITSIVSNATFNGLNAVKNSGKAIVAILDDQASSTLTIAAQDLSLTGTNISLTTSSKIDTQSAAATVVTNLETSLKNVNASLSKLGSGAKRLELQKNFVTKLSDTIETGIGNLVDADLAKESAKLQALQVKQQLGMQALSIANQQPSTVLSLFR
ncbi:flagellin [Govanella unica]|uniref:Flagellin n=1 Tax=Govanella unica TaxID=2975056 RepID=A0A9X3TXL0_9PROT|nr:flagellin [Govania unica]MDA5193207.1 flagellin [Govania unica]